MENNFFGFFGRVGSVITEKKKNENYEIMYNAM